MLTARTLLLALITLGILVVIILTWGSIGSVTLTFCLLMMAASLLYQRFFTNNDNNDFDMEQ